jgi:hypothetical protein
MFMVAALWCCLNWTVWRAGEPLAVFAMCRHFRQGRRGGAPQGC